MVREDVVVDEMKDQIPCDVRPQSGGASTKEICCLRDAFLPGQTVTNRAELKEENVPADKADVPFALSFVWMIIICHFLENHEDIGCAFRISLRIHGLYRVSDKPVGGVVRTYLSVCITERFRLLIGSARINRILAFSICEARLCGLIWLMLRGSVARTARRFGSCCVAWFALEGHDVIWINSLGRRARSAGRSTSRRRDFGDERVERGRRDLALSCRRCCRGHGLVVIGVVVPDDARRIHEFAIRAYSTIVRCH
jgi:hypothetical protein